MLLNHFSNIKEILLRKIKQNFINYYLNKDRDFLEYELDDKILIFNNNILIKK